MIQEDFLKILACPETKQSLKIADAGLVEKINQGIKAGSIQNRSGQKVSEPIESGLVAVDRGAYLYPIRNEIPVLLIEESIPIQGA